MPVPTSERSKETVVQADSQTSEPDNTTGQDFIFSARATTKTRFDDTDSWSTTLQDAENKKLSKQKALFTSNSDSTKRKAAGPPCQETTDSPAKSIKVSRNKNAKGKKPNASVLSDQKGPQPKKNKRTNNTTGKAVKKADKLAKTCSPTARISLPSVKPQKKCCLIS
ncbi:hypothetical protein BIW11_12542 [Tropilaelaps mercedesae]|uniref:Uncharacterized protein n=1 Tax=Tropilaelaps mercedesae TaxID=418985 RepID=A0A1V9X5X6_9ACAR|nr:hypothetical protein BIW11_12542 [Tropilaelaps mercedesae]